MSIFRNFRNGLVSLSMVRRCAILEMKSGENRFNPEFIEQLNNALDEVEKSDEVDALVTVGSGKFFSNGLDIPFVMDSDKDKVSVFMKDYSKLMARFLTFPMPTAAAINGHAYAGGGILAMMHDYRFMRKDRGWMCLNEVRLRLRFPPGLCCALCLKISQKQAFSDFYVFGKKYTGPEAAANKLVDGVCDVNELKEKSVKTLEDLVGKEQFDRASLRTMKMDMYKDAVFDLTRDFTFKDLELFSPSSKF